MVKFKIDAKLLKYIFINILILFFVSLIIISVVHNNNNFREGFGMSDLNKAVDKIDDIKDLTKGIPKQINSIEKELKTNITEKFDKTTDRLTNNLNKLGKTIEKNTVNKVTQIGSELDENLQSLGETIEKNTLAKVYQLGEEIKQNTADQMISLGEEIENNTADVFTNKLKSIFTQLGNMLNDGLINPIIDLFTGISDIFIQILGILKEIGNKIVQFPNCVLTYAIQSTFDTMYYLYNTILPEAIRYPLSFIYKYTLGLIIEFISNITGFTDSVNKCYGFNIRSEINKINSNLEDIDSSFKDNFGDINFNKIKI